MFKNKKLLSIVLVVFIFFSISVLSNCSKTSNEGIKKTEKVIKVGAILPLTGILSVMGKVEMNAMNLAIDDLKGNDKNIKIIFEDCKGDPKTAVSAANKLINIDNVDVLLVSTTGSALAVQPIASSKNINMFAFCMDPDIAASSDFVMRFYIGIREEAKGILKYFNNKSNINVGILYGEVPVWEKVVNNDFIPFFKNASINVKFNESYPLDKKDFSQLIIKMKASKIDHLIILGYGFEYPNIFKSMEELKILKELQIIGGWGFLYTPVKKELLENILVSGPEYVFRKNSLAKSFYNNYQNKYNSNPNFDAAFAYNAIWALGNNIERSDLNKPLKTIYKGKKEFNGVVGSYYFDKKGNMIVKTGLGKIIKGEIKISNNN